LKQRVSDKLPRQAPVSRVPIVEVPPDSLRDSDVVKVFNEVASEMDALIMEEEFLVTDLARLLVSKALALIFQQRDGKGRDVLGRLRFDS